MTAIGDLLLNVDAKLEIAVGEQAKLATQLGRVERAQRRPPAQPASSHMARHGIASSAGYVVLNFGGPTQGRIWYVRNIVVGGLTVTTTAAGRADVFVSATDLGQVSGGLASIGLTDWRDQAVLLPLIAFYGRGELALSSAEQLFVIFSGGTAAQDYVSGVSFEEVEQAADPEVFAL